MSIIDSNRSSQGQGQGEGERESEGESALALQAAMKELAGLRETRERTEDMVRTHSASVYFPHPCSAYFCLPDPFLIFLPFFNLSLRPSTTFASNIFLLLYLSGYEFGPTKRSVQSNGGPSRLDTLSLHCH